MDPNTFLYNVPPFVILRFCEIMDTGCHRYGWRGLAARIVPSFTEVRMYERMEAGGRSPTKELLWCWAQQNPRVQDLLEVLQDMGHYRAMQLFQDQCYAVKGTVNAASKLPGPGLYISRVISTDATPLPLSNKCELTGHVSPTNKREAIGFETSHSHDTMSPREPQPQITLQNIVAGTRDFNQEMRISEGCFSDVYLARIGGDMFAVKLFKQVNNVSWKKLWDVFRKEMEIHRLCRHPNILELLGCFSDETRYCLVYPYMSKGSLFHRLHHQNSGPPLSWQERLAVINGIAKALHHLHTAQPCAVICGNLSSSNILLDDAMQAKLSDFGLARLRPHSANRLSTITLGAGSHGNPAYLPEEYLRNGKLSAGLDVFSFGMVVMETVTGRQVVAELPKRTLLRDLLTSEAEDSGGGGGVDSCLQFLDASAGRWPTSLERSLLDLSLRCVASHPSRPSMENVLQTLGQLLPPSGYLSLDRPHSLDDGAPIGIQHSPSPSIPVEHDEQRSLPGSPKQARPCECSQSEVTYISATETEDVKTKGEGNPSYGSWPVQCSCQAETGLSCEDCRANGFSSTNSELAQ
ncbi:interleukin-1 receptor-associated kinase 3 isoform X1 [Hippocampus comes]|uniref:interleukin-1 receptor-associated kinase 3 isoform X1 n=1 Tax=Hippocampus comes TaxID=109280 RepID=UPI00094E39FD|nr:PREDICTED: interleukin-1 receptor-associated kinase 3-like isoform X1 [Hippocampus comes]